MEDFFDVIGLDLGSGKRNVDLNKENKKMLNKVVDDFKNPTTLKDVKEIYGNTLPTSLSNHLGNVPYDIPEGKEIVQAPGIVNRILGIKLLQIKIDLED